MLSDSGATVPAGKSKFRVVHLADLAPPLLAWRTQPDYDTLSTIQFPFQTRNVTPYVQSDAGTWTVVVAIERYNGGVAERGDSVAATGPIVIPPGESRTVVLMERAGGGVNTAVLSP